MTNLSLQGRVALVTHGSSEMGLGICAALGGAGASVVFGADEPGAVQQATGELERGGICASGWQTDRAHIGSVGELVEAAVARHGRLDIMVNTSVITAGAPAASMALDQFVQGIAVNLNTMFFGCQFAARQMLAQAPAGGTIVNVTSVGGVVALPGHADYCSAMAGVNAITKILATEWGPQGIRVVGVGAGLSTELLLTLTVQPALPGGERLSQRRVPARCLTSAADVAQAVVYLCGDGAKHISGTTLYVDGGWLADGYWE